MKRVKGDYKSGEGKEGMIKLTTRLIASMVRSRIDKKGISCWMNEERRKVYDDQNDKNPDIHQTIFFNNGKETYTFDIEIRRRMDIGDCQVYQFNKGRKGSGVIGFKAKRPKH